MPRFVRRRVRRFRPRRFRPRRFRRMIRRRFNRIPPARCPVKTKQLARLKYSCEFDLNPGAVGAADVHVFRANSLYDPDLTDIGHQPRGFDEWMALYYRYLVIGFKIIVRCAADNATTDDTMIYICHRTTDSTSTDMSDYAEGASCRSGVCAGGAGASPLTLSLSGSSWKLRQIPKPMANHVDNSGTNAANPSVLTYIHVAAAPMYSVDSGAIHCHADLSFLAIFFAPNEVSQS